MLSVSLSSKLIHYHSLHGSSDQHLSPPRRSAMDQSSCETTWSNLVSSQAAFPCSQQPAGLVQLTRVNWVVPSLRCHQNEWLSPNMWEVKRRQPGQGRAALFPWEAVNVTLSTLVCHLDKVTSQRQVKLINWWFSLFIQVPTWPLSPPTLSSSLSIKLAASQSKRGEQLCHHRGGVWLRELRDKMWSALWLLSPGKRYMGRVRCTGLGKSWVLSLGSTDS